MPEFDDDFQTRLATLEREVAQLREEVALASSDAAAARVLAAGADHDVSEVRAELRAHTQGLNALRETQLEHGHKIDELSREMREGFAEQDQKMREGFAEQDQKMRQGFATLATDMAQITALLTKLTES